MKDARYLIRVANDGTHRPVDASRLLGRVRELVLDGDSRVINLRVSSLALEFDLYISDGKSPDLPLSKLDPLGRILTCKRLDVPPPAVIIAQTIVEEARHLWNEERYWEVHEVLEDLWKQCTGNEKQLIQGLILAAASLVHRQKNENRVITSMMQDAVRRLQNQPSPYYGWDVTAFRKNLEQIFENPNMKIPTI